VLALILFAVLVGMASSAAGEKGRPFTEFLVSAGEVFGKVITYILYYAPIGMAAYFAYLVAVNGPYLLRGYLRVVTLYYPMCIAYFFIAFTFYTYLAARGAGVRKFWSNILPPSMMAAGTCSSFATIPVNLQAADRIGIPREISETIIPIGATVHIDGSCMAAVMKIAFLFCLFGRPIDGFETLAGIVGIAILSGAVIPGIPGGGITGEILIVSMYGFPPESLVYIKVIGDLVDPPATLVNAIGDNVASMLVSRILGGRDWLQKTASGVQAADLEEAMAK
jgi:Na+/H+-dicarboxylate symporter